MGKRERISLAIWTVLSIAIAGVITYFSGQTAVESDGVSMGTVRGILLILFGNAPAETIARYNHLARKAAHFLLYFLLGLSLTGVFQHQKRVPKLLAAVPCAAAFAALDEFHQRFVAGRGPRLSDVLLDSCGAAAGALLMTGALYWLEKHRKRPDAIS